MTVKPWGSDGTMKRPPTERYDRMVSRFWIFNAPSPIAQQGAGAEPERPGAVLPTPAGTAGAGLSNLNRKQLCSSHRRGVSLSADQWVIRGGYGLYYLGQKRDGVESRLQSSGPTRFTTLDNLVSPRSI